MSAFTEAQRIARAARRSGYPEAEAARDYCIDGQIGPDGFYTRTVSVYLGERQPIRPNVFMRFARSLLNSEAR